MVYRFTFFAAILLLSCGGRQPQPFTINNNAAPAHRPASDSLFDAVMASHDVAMAKLNKTERLQKRAKALADSINRLPTTLQKENIKNDYDSLARNLAAAANGMNEWMQQFKYDSLQGNEPARVQYLQAEKEKIDKVKTLMLSSLERADKLSIQ